jgi:hypothetical protein
LHVDAFPSAFTQPQRSYLIVFAPVMSEGKHGLAAQIASKFNQQTLAVTISQHQHGLTAIIKLHLR